MNHNSDSVIQLIKSPTRIQAAGQPPKLIEELIGRVNSGSADVSIARMHSPSGWSEPGQTPDFDEYSIVLHGELLVETRKGKQNIHAGQAISVPRGQWVRYSTPGSQGAEYISVCLPAFSPQSVHRDQG